MSSKTLEAWKRLDEAFAVREHIRAEELLFLTARDIKKVAGREPRLMVKFDTQEQVPSILSRGTILPVENGTYVIAPGPGHHRVEPSSETVYWPVKDDARQLTTLPWSQGPSSESQAVAMALTSGLLDDFRGTKGLEMTVQGRLRSPRFSFRFQGYKIEHRISVDGVQIEVDAGLEWGGELTLLEAKMGTRRDFPIRQLFYPYRMWKQRGRDLKAVTCVFMGYSNRRYCLREYAFPDPGDFHGLRLVKAKDYVLEDATGVVSGNLDAAADTDRTLVRPDTAFPQADVFPRVLDVVDAIGAERNTTEDLARRYGFSSRQAQYYSRAAMYLGWVSRERGGTLKLTAAGQRLLVSNLEGRHRLALQALAVRPVFHGLLQESRRGELPSKKEVRRVLASETNLSGDTVGRRARTVLSWLRYFQASSSGLG